MRLTGIIGTGRQARSSRQLGQGPVWDALVMCNLSHKCDKCGHRSHHALADMTAPPPCCRTQRGEVSHRIFYWVKEAHLERYAYSSRDGFFFLYTNQSLRVLYRGGARVLTLTSLILTETSKSGNAAKANNTHAYSDKPHK